MFGPDKEVGECDCDCHTDPGTVAHFVACCTPCPHCKKNIEPAFFDSHVAGHQVTADDLELQARVLFPVLPLDG